MRGDETAVILGGWPMDCRFCYGWARWFVPRFVVGLATHKLVGLNVDEVKTRTVIVEVDRAEKPVHQMGTTKIRSGFVGSHESVEYRRLFCLASLWNHVSGAPENHFIVILRIKQHVPAKHIEPLGVAPCLAN
jgi:hypothetical protein